MKLMVCKKAFFGVFAILLLAPLAVWADAVGSFTKIEGQVDLVRTTGGGAAVVRVGDSVSMGDAIRTKRNSKAEIQFKDESVIQLAPETRISIDEYSFRGGARERGMIGLFRGKIRAIVSKLRASVIPASLGGSDFNIKTPTAIAGVKGTDLIVYYERGVSGVMFLSGNGFVLNPSMPDRVIPIRGGQATFVAGGNQAPRPAVNVSEAFLAPHLKGTTVSLTGGSAGPGETPGNGNGNPQDINVDVTTSNTNYTSLTGDTFGDPISGGQSGDSLAMQFVNDTTGGTGGTVGDNPVTIPVTDSNPNLLGTPVTVTVTKP